MPFQNEQLLTFDAYPRWHTGFITSIASTRANAERGKKQANDASPNNTNGDPTSETGQETFPAKGDEVHGVMGGVVFNAIVLVRHFLPTCCLQFFPKLPSQPQHSLTAYIRNPLRPSFPGLGRLYITYSAASTRSALRPRKTTSGPRRLCRWKALRECLRG